MEIGGFELHGLAELFAGGFVFAGFQERVGKVLADVGAVRRESDGFFKGGNGGVVVVQAQGIEGVS
jgi:hypothetical protein